ncbi:class I SAM-dependent methyltransferase [Radiobacillus sp. PE A8.2]|uniref:class I SAM-dependent methyltransferase n=1 Tax=Radiobacillus sp. PE A8.2 TaxID=3380349 RepID=UPI00388FFEC2
MEQTKVEQLFRWIDETTENVEQHMDIPYVDSLTLALEYLFSGEETEEMNDLTKHELQKSVKNIDIEQFKKEEIRKAIQLAALKGMKGATQQQHLMTPDTVAMFIGYLANKFTRAKEKLHLFDPACGTGNLITAVGNQLDNIEKAFGSEVDPSLIKLSYISANLQQQEIEFFHQDSLRPFLLEPVDLIVSDLPVGYYPDDLQANKYELKADQGHSYAHHLFIEQSVNYMKDGGYLLFVVPNFLFDSDQSDKLHVYLQKHTHIVGLLQLPASLFKSENNAKSILVLQKKGEGTKAPKQALMAQLPSFKNPAAMDQILGQMHAWFKQEGLV